MGARDIQNGPLMDHTGYLGTHKIARVAAHYAADGRPSGRYPGKAVVILQPTI